MYKRRVEAGLTIGNVFNGPIAATQPLKPQLRNHSGARLACGKVGSELGTCSVRFLVRCLARCLVRYLRQERLAMKLGCQCQWSEGELARVATWRALGEH